MALVATVGAADADTYATLDEAVAHLTAMNYSGLAEWTTLTAAEKEIRLRLGAKVVDALPLRGAKACYNQAREFPRWWPGDSGYPSWEKTYLDYSDIDASLAPTISADIKAAHIELTYHYIHNGVMTLDSMAHPEQEVKSFSLGGGELAIQFADAGSKSYATLSKARMTSLDSANLYLTKWLRRFSGGII